MNQKTSKVEKEFYLRCSYLTLSVLFDKEPSFSNGAISESTSEMEKASRMSEINFGVSLVFWGKQEIS
ncbi:hypothetical protein GBM45_10275 [Enterococcus faecium]|nr:hypothetical protein GBM45_10275 [Enterococcus faecium]